MLYKSNVLTLEPCSIFWLGYVVVNINAGAKLSFLLIIIVYETLCGHCRCLGQVLYYR